MQLLAPLRFRFTDPDDVAQFGDGWWTYDEAEITRLRGRELIALEEALDLSVRVVIRGFRADATAATMAAMWIALHRAGHPVAWADFNPVVMATDWERVPDAPLDSGEAPEPDSSSSTATTPNEESPASSQA